MRRSHGSSLPLWGLVLLLSFVSCRDFGDPPPRIDLSPPSPSIEGIHLGDSPAQVQSVLGPPPSTGWLDGLGGAWRTYQYGYANRHSFSLLVAFINTPGVEEWGPVDFVWVLDGYTGKTAEGIGIGAGRAIVYRFYGTPQRSIVRDSLGGSDDSYCRGKYQVQFQFKRDTISGISLGPFKPTVYDLTCQ